MENIRQLMEVQVFGNPVYRYLFSLAFYLVLLLALRIFEHVVVRKLKKITSTNTRKRSAFFIELFERTALPALYFAAFYFASIQLKLAPGISRVIHSAWVVVLAYHVTRFSVSLLLYALQEVWIHKHTKQETTPAFRSLLNILRVAVWAIGIVFVLDNLGFNVGAVVAGLGITGIAVALAAQTILGDLFNYFVIFFDRPFEEGDFVVTDNYMGVIENIGVKSTRIRSLEGEQIVISNSNLTNSRIRNFKRMAERRVAFKFGIVYITDLEKIKKIPAVLKSIVSSHQGIRFDRAHFYKFGDHSLDFEIVYYVLSPDYNKYMDIQQSINLQILEAFREEEIKFAYPQSMEYQHKPLPEVPNKV